MTNAKVCEGDKEIARHYGGYLPFLVDVSEILSDSQSHTFTVKVDNRDDKNTPPGKPTKGLDFLYYGGIYRNVNLIIKPKIYITHPAEYEDDCGISVTTEKCEEGWKLSVRTVIANKSGINSPCEVRISLTDSGKEITSFSETKTVQSKGRCVLRFTRIVSDIKEWNTDDPFLYSLNISVKSQFGEDAENTYIGFRQAESGNAGFKLNGKKIRLYGVNRGQQYPYLGIAVSDEAHRREARMLKESGINCLRLSHYPHSPAFLDECDKSGILVIDPAPGWQYIGGRLWKKRFCENVRDMVKRDRNHACCVIFEITPNESAWANRRGDRFFRKLHESVKALCPTALTSGDTVGRRDAEYIGLDVPYTGEDKLSRKRKLYENGEKTFLTREHGDWCIHLLPIMTCLGNGLGGGDFSAPTDETTYSLVSTWAYDVISIEDYYPVKYEEIKPVFKEKGWD